MLQALNFGVVHRARMLPRAILGGLIADDTRRDDTWRDDARAYAATQTRGAKAPLFSRLAVLPVVRWSYATSAPTSSTASLVVVPVTLTFRLKGENADATWLETVTLVRGSSGWRVSSEVSRGERTALWDLGTLRVVTGTRSLVIGVDTPTSTLRRYATTADRVVPQVTAVWGKGWSRYAVVVVPRSVTQLGRALGRSAASLDGYAAVTTAEGSPTAGHGVAERVWVNTPAMAELSALGRQRDLVNPGIARHDLELGPRERVQGRRQQIGWRHAARCTDHDLTLARVLERRELRAGQTMPHLHAGRHAAHVRHLGDHDAGLVALHGGIERQGLREHAEHGAVARGRIVHVLGRHEAAAARHVLRHDRRLARDVPAQELRSRPTVQVVAPADAVADEHAQRLAAVEVLDRIGTDGVAGPRQHGEDHTQHLDSRGHADPFRQSKTRCIRHPTS